MASRAAERMTPQEVAVITLTYGDRSAMLAQMISAVAADGVRHVLVLANGLSPDAAARLEELSRNCEEDGIHVHVHASAQNLGSSEGYGRLIGEVLALPDAGAAWFLDDDNVPRPGSLALLLTAQAEVGGAVSGVRTDRYYLMETARTGRANPHRPGEAFGIDLRSPFRRLWAKVARAFSGAPADPPAAVAIPRVPYGGLLVPRGQLQTIAPPRPDFVIYADDYDYSARLASGGGLHLVGRALIDDLEASWNATKSGSTQTKQRRQSQTFRLATMKPDFRLYYSLRNTLWMDRNRVTLPSLPMFVINLGWLVLLSVGYALCHGRGRNARVILQAAVDAVRGRLGRNAAFPLP